MSAEDRVVYWQRRARDAERCLEFEKDAYERCRTWALDGPFTELNRLRARCEFLYCKAMEHGATHDELRQP